MHMDIKISIYATDDGSLFGSVTQRLPLADGQPEEVTEASPQPYGG